MQTVLPSEFKRGMVLMLDGAPHFLEDFHVAGSAQSKHKLHTRLRNLKTGRLTDHVFTDNDRVAVAALEHRRVQFSYRQGDRFVFMDAESFDEVVLTAEQIGERHWFLKENEEYRALALEGRLLDIALPPTVPLQIVETAPAQGGGSDAAWKPATLETGLEIMVPLFIDKGEVVRVDTAARKYLGKESGEKHGRSGPVKP
ncbi:MAG: elongation factor P [Verrucomicrobia bacterium]|nr:elongation factor P [Verrucomicrobiota bacterium]